MNDPVLARLAALKTTPTPKLKEQWRQLFESEPPAFNRRYLESRLAYRSREGNSVFQTLQPFAKPIRMFAGSIRPETAASPAPSSAPPAAFLPVSPPRSPAPIMSFAAPG